MRRAQLAERRGWRRSPPPPAPLASAPLASAPLASAPLASGPLAPLDELAVALLDGLELLLCTPPQLLELGEQLLVLAARAVALGVRLDGRGDRLGVALPLSLGDGGGALLLELPLERRLLAVELLPQLGLLGLELPELEPQRRRLALQLKGALESRALLLAECAHRGARVGGRLRRRAHLRLLREEPRLRLAQLLGGACEHLLLALEVGALPRELERPLVALRLDGAQLRAEEPPLLRARVPLELEGLEPVTQLLGLFRPARKLPLAHGERDALVVQPVLCAARRLAQLVGARQTRRVRLGRGRRRAAVHRRRRLHHEHVNLQ